MSTAKRVALALLIAAIVLFLGFLFSPFVLTKILEPAAVVVWLILRILVLSIHQKYFWYAAILAAIIVLYRLLPRARMDVDPDTSAETNSTMTNIAYWRGQFIYNGETVREQKNLKRELTYLLASLYASKQSTSNDYRIHDALQQGKIPLPQNIHAILFAQEPSLSGGPLRRFIGSIRRTATKRIRQWTGQEEAEHYKMIDELLTFMETSLEIKHDDRKPS